MKKLLMTVLMLVGVATFAGVEAPYRQFVEGDYNLDSRPSQPDYSQELISLKIYGSRFKEGTSVWLSNMINSWNWAPDLDGKVYDMKSTTERYGYMLKKDFENNGVLNYDVKKEDYPKIYWGSGEKDITYYDDDNPNNRITTKGYFLGHFDTDVEIYLVMTTLPPEEDAGETVDSYQYVLEANNPNSVVTSLESRQIRPYDFANNVIVNFGMHSEYYEGSREFVAIYDGEYKEDINGASGGPLPGVFFAGLLSLGTVFGASKAKRQKRA